MFGNYLLSGESLEAIFSTPYEASESVKFFTVYNIYLFAELFLLLWYIAYIWCITLKNIIIAVYK